MKIIFSIQKPQGAGHTVQVVQYADNHPTTSLKSLKDVNSLVDNISLTSNRLILSKENFIFEAIQID